jgi:hypothetical protein
MGTEIVTEAGKAPVRALGAEVLARVSETIIFCCRMSLVMNKTLSALALDLLWHHNLSLAARDLVRVEICRSKDLINFLSSSMRTTLPLYSSCLSY